MIQFLFTLDYEIYGNGKGSLRELVLEPTQRLAELFKQYNVPFVVFTEALEFAKMEETQSDPAISEVRTQLRSLHAAGHEIALHLHPQWANACHRDGQWELDYSEYTIGVLPRDRIAQIVDMAIGWLRGVMGNVKFKPLSFRAGNWLFQPTHAIAAVLSERGIRIDSSVFKGGRIHGLGLDYRPALKNGNSWRFSTDVNVPDASGPLVEVPIHIEMVPFWEMLGLKRLRLQNKVPGNANNTPRPSRWRDYLRLRYPRKLDFCRMTAVEMRAVMERILVEARKGREEPMPIVAIGHSKDLVDFDAVKRMLDYLVTTGVSVTTFENILPQLSAPGLA